MQLLDGPPQYPLVEGPGRHEKLGQDGEVLPVPVKAVDKLLVLSRRPGRLREDDVRARHLEPVDAGTGRLELP